MILGGPSYPSIGLVCANCGNTQVINAVVAGIIDGDSSVDKPTVNKSDE